MVEDFYQLLGKVILPGWVIRSYGVTYQALYSPNGESVNWKVGEKPPVKFSWHVWNLAEYRVVGIADENGSPIEKGGDSSQAHWAIINYNPIGNGVSMDRSWAILERIAVDAILPVPDGY
jgi:hypothetical protein